MLDAHRASPPPARGRARACATRHRLGASVTSASRRQQRRDGERRREVVLVVEDLDVQRHRVGLAADVAGDDRHRAELAHRARVAEDHAVEQAPLDVGQRHAPERLPAAGARATRGLLLLAPCACISGISSRATNGKVTKIVASTMPGTAKMILMSCAASHGPNQPCSAEQQHEDQAGDHRRDGERQVDQRDQQRLPGNSNLAIAQAAATPKTRLSGTAIAGDEQRQRIARSASGSRSAAK